MLLEPLSITVGGTTYSLNRVETAGKRSLYMTTDEALKLEVSHQVTGKDRVRHVLRLTHRKVVTNPLDSSNDYDEYTETRTIDRPAVGWSETEVVNLVAGFNTFDGAALVAKLYGQQH